MRGWARRRRESAYLRSSKDVKSIRDIIDESDYEAKFTIRKRVDGVYLGNTGDRSRAFVESLADTCRFPSGGALVQNHSEGRLVEAVR